MRNAGDSPARAEVEGRIRGLEEQQKQQQLPPNDVKPVDVPPRPVVEVPPVVTAPVEVVAVPAVTPTPTYKKWWVWTTVGVIVVVGVGLGVGLSLGLPPSVPGSALGNRKVY